VVSNLLTKRSNHTNQTKFPCHVNYYVNYPKHASIDQYFPKFLMYKLNRRPQNIFPLNNWNSQVTIFPFNSLSQN